CVLGLYLHKWGRPGEATAEFHQAVHWFHEALRVEPHNLRALQLLAWLRCTCPQQELRVPAEAVKLAETACKYHPQHGACWNTLGLARYRAGDYRAALDALNKVQSLHAGGDGLNGFLLAMVHAQLKDRRQARKWYNQALAWRAEQNRVGYEYL